jgi:hypothetical protein
MGMLVFRDKMNGFIPKTSFNVTAMVVVEQWCGVESVIVFP